MKTVGIIAIAILASYIPFFTLGLFAVIQNNYNIIGAPIGGPLDSSWRVTLIYIISYAMGIYYVYFPFVFTALVTVLLARSFDTRSFIVVFTIGQLIVYILVGGLTFGTDTIVNFILLTMILGILACLTKTYFLKRGIRKNSIKR